MSGAAPSSNSTKDGLQLSDEFRTFLMSHKDEVIKLLQKETPAPTISTPVVESKGPEKKMKDSSSESESSMPRRRSPSASSSASSDDCSTSRDERRKDDKVKEEKERRTTRSRSRSSSPVRYRRRREATTTTSTRRERSESRSRSRSSTPARYARQVRREMTSSSSSHHHHHRDSRRSRRDSDRSEQHYESGARRSGFIRSRNMVEDGRDNPHPSNCLGVFGMPPWIREYDMRNMFEPYGEIDQLNVVINRHTGQCRGYGFVYYATVEEAKRARSAMRDAKIDGIPIRVDFSVTDQRRRRD